MTLAIAACFGMTAGVAACGGKSGARSSTNHPTQQQRLVVAMNAFAGCARAHGVPVPDADQNGQIPGAEDLQRKYVNTPQGQLVLHACQHELSVAQQLNYAAQGTTRQGALRFARCMRAHGIPVNDPSSNGDVTGPPHKIDKSSPQVQAAVTACNRLVANGTAAR